MLIQKVKWKRGRVAYGVGLENRSVEMHREFESHRFRQHNALVDKLAKSLLSKGRVLSVRLRARVPVLGC